MATQTDGLTPMTDAQGRYLLAEDEMTEPREGSVILTDGPWGTAYQRYFSDRLWHRVGGGRGMTWADLLTSKRNIHLAYDANKREG